MYHKNSVIFTEKLQTKFKLSISKVWVQLLLLVVFTAGLQLSCTDDIPPSSALSQGGGVLKVDTVNISNVSSTVINNYSGGLSSAPFGSYSDAAYGDITTVGLFQPNMMNHSIIDTLTLNTDNTEFYLSLKFDYHYGDTLNASTFKLIEVTRRWRANSWQLDSIPVLKSLDLGTITITNEDSIAIRLPFSWSNRYVGIFYSTPSGTAINQSRIDSTYFAQMFGFALVSENSNQIIGLSRSNSKLLVINPDTTHKIPIVKSAFSLNRTNVPEYAQNNLYDIYSTFESSLKLKFDAASANNGVIINGKLIPSKSISRADILVYQDTLIEQTGLPLNHTRPTSRRASIYFSNEGSINFDVHRSPTFTTNYDTNLGGYRLNITQVFNAIVLGSLLEDEFYLTLNSLDGFIRSGLFYSENHPQLNPKLVITYLVPTE